jgi:hypothetical protein
MFTLNNFGSFFPFLLTEYRIDVSAAQQGNSKWC